MRRTYEMNIENLTMIFSAHYVDDLSKNDTSYFRTLKKFEFPPHAGKLDEVHKCKYWLNYTCFGRYGI